MNNDPIEDLSHLRDHIKDTIDHAIPPVNTVVVGDSDSDSQLAVITRDGLTFLVTVQWAKFVPDIEGGEL